MMITKQLLSCLQRMRICIKVSKRAAWQLLSELINRNETKRSEAKRSEAKRSEAKRSESKRSEAKRNETKRNETKRNETKRNETKRNETKRNETKRNETKRNETKRAASDTHFPQSTCCTWPLGHHPVGRTSVPPEQPRLLRVGECVHHDLRFGRHPRVLCPLPQVVPLPLPALLDAHRIDDDGVVGRNPAPHKHTSLHSTRHLVTFHQEKVLLRKTHPKKMCC